MAQSFDAVVDAVRRGLLSGWRMLDVTEELVQQAEQVYEEMKKRVAEELRADLLLDNGIYLHWQKGFHLSLGFATLFSATRCTKQHVLCALALVCDSAKDQKPYVLSDELPLGKRKVHIVSLQNTRESGPFGGAKPVNQDRASVKKGERADVVLVADGSGPCGEKTAEFVVDKLGTRIAENGLDGVSDVNAWRAVDE